MAEGWIKLHRSIRKNWIWEDAQKLKWWLDILLQANHQDKKILLGNDLFTIERGSFHTSEVKLSERWKVDRKTVRRFLELLQKDNMISIEKSKRGTTIKISNYNDFQDFSTDEKDNRRDNKVPTQGTTEGTDKSHISPNQGDTNNNDKECNKNEEELKNEKKAISTEALELCKYYGTLIPGQSITSHLATLKMYVEMYGFDLTKEAMQKTIKNIKRFNPGYMEKILKGWVENGKEEVGHGTNSKTTGPEHVEGIGFTVDDL